MPTPRPLAWPILLALTAILTAAPLAAQQVEPPPSADTAAASRPFGGMTASPISATTVLHGRLVPGADSGAVLVYAVAVRGPAGWYNHQTNVHAIPGDSLPEGMKAEIWHVGDREYDMRYDQSRDELTVLGRTFDLRRGRLLMVDIDGSPEDSSRVVQGPPKEFHLRRPGPFEPLFLKAAPELREFAGTRP